MEGPARLDEVTLSIMTKGAEAGWAGGNQTPPGVLIRSRWRSGQVVCGAGS